MSLETLHKILDDLADVLIAVYLFGYGEPFMNEDLPRMIEACTDRGILTLTSTNGHFVQTLDDALSVVDAGLTTLVIAIDGSTQEIYQSYRRSGDLGKAMRCASLIEEAKVCRGSPYPYTALRSVVTRENERDLPNLERLACDLGMNMFTYKSLGCMTNSERYGEYEPASGEMRRFEYAGPSRITGRLVRCPFPFRQPSVFWDGTVVGSEHDYEKEMAFGRIGEQSFSEIWNSPQALKLRRSIWEGRDRPSFCDACPLQDLSQRGVELSCTELRGIPT
jgi:MoaA/NifB/PqqE/SkfB family radical SAM enzyme